MVRHLIKVPRDIHKWSMLLYWPLINIVLWGFAARWISGDGTAATSIILSGVVLSELSNLSTYNIAAHLLEELWTANVSNIFATSITLFEWVISAIGVALVIMLFEAFYCSTVVYLLYGNSIVHALGWYLVPTVLMLTMTGIIIGFFAVAPLFIWGQRVESFTFMFGWVFAPLSGIFYPVSVLPPLAQTISRAIPMRHVFDAVRSYIETGVYLWDSIYIACALCIVYGTLGIVTLVAAYRYSRSRGLARLAS